MMRKSLLPMLALVLVLIASGCTSFYNTLGGAMDDASGVQYRNFTKKHTYSCRTGPIDLRAVQSSNRWTMYVTNRSRQAVTVEVNMENHDPEKIYVPAGSSGSSRTYHARYSMDSTPMRTCHGTR